MKAVWNIMLEKTPTDLIPIKMDDMYAKQG